MYLIVLVYLITLILIISNIVFLIKYRLNFFQKIPLLILMSIMFTVCIYAYLVHIKTIYIKKAILLEKDFYGILSSYEVEKGNYPEGLDSLNSFSEYKEKIYWLYYPLDPPKFNYVITSKDSLRLAYIFYAYGFDNDDDSLESSYPLEFKYALNPFFNGDFIIKKDSLKYQ